MIPCLGLSLRHGSEDDKGIHTVMGKHRLSVLRPPPVTSQTRHFYLLTVVLRQRCFRLLLHYRVPSPQ
jgi:hypothetical protein